MSINDTWIHTGRGIHLHLLVFSSSFSIYFSCVVPFPSSFFSVSGSDNSVLPPRLPSVVVGPSRRLLLSPTSSLPSRTPVRREGCWWTSGRRNLLIQNPTGWSSLSKKQRAPVGHSGFPGLRPHLCAQSYSSPSGWDNLEGGRIMVGGFGHSVLLRRVSIEFMGGDPSQDFEYLNG